MELPEHEKLKAIQPLSQSIGEFLEWCKEQGLYLCSDVNGADRYVPITKSNERLLASYFGIDLWTLEREKEAILAQQRELNATRR